MPFHLSNKRCVTDPYGTVLLDKNAAMSHALVWPSIPGLLNINSRATTKAWLMAAFLSSSTVPYGSVTQRLLDKWK